MFCEAKQRQTQKESISLGAKSEIYPIHQFFGIWRRGEEEEDGGGPSQVAEECHQIDSVPPSTFQSLGQFPFSSSSSFWVCFVLIFYI